MQTFGWCHNGYHNRPPDDVVLRARRAQLDGLIVKYGDPAFERALTSAAVAWATERFAYASEAAAEGNRLADAIDAGARFAVANCEPEGGWSDENAASAIRLLINTFRSRHSTVPLYVCADLRAGRSLNAPFVREAARGGVTGWMPMVYPRAFGQPVVAAFDAAFPGGRYLGLPCAPVIQTYDDVGSAMVREQIAEAKQRGAASLSIYVVETATDEELQAVATAKSEPGPEPDLLQRLAVAYRRGAIAILDHGTPAELANWGGLWSGIAARIGGGGGELASQEVLGYLRGALAILDHGAPAELRSWGEHFAGNRDGAS